MSLSHILRLVSLIAGLVYFVSIPWHPFPGITVLKGLSVGSLALLVWIAVPWLDSRHRTLLATGLTLSSLGDVLLDVSSSMFVFGLGAFLLAHLCYIALFWGERRKGDKLGLVRMILAVILVCFSSFFSFWLIPALGDMALPVTMYIGVISAMVFSALAWRTNTTHSIVYGAFLFLISDAVLGAAKFRGPVPLRSWIVWGTYYSAQFLITFGVLRELSSRRR